MLTKFESVPKINFVATFWNQELEMYIKINFLKILVVSLSLLYWPLTSTKFQKRPMSHLRYT